MIFTTRVSTYMLFFSYGILLMSICFWKNKQTNKKSQINTKSQTLWELKLNIWSANCGCQSSPGLDYWEIQGLGNGFGVSDQTSWLITLACFRWAVTWIHCDVSSLYPCAHSRPVISETEKSPNGAFTVTCPGCFTMTHEHAAYTGEGLG